jgi:hypothetical protein
MKMDQIKIGDERFSSADLELLTGQEVTAAAKPAGYILLLAKVLSDPMRLPKLLKDVCSLCLSLEDEDSHELRMALLRIQIDSELRMHEDIPRYQQRRYVAQVIELLIYKELLLAPRELAEEEID